MLSPLTSTVRVTAGLLGLFLTSVAWCAQTAPQSAPAERPEFIPKLRDLDWKDGVYSLERGATIYFDAREEVRADQRSLERHAGVLAHELFLLTDRPFLTRPLAEREPGAGGIVLRFQAAGGRFAATEEDETHGYELEVTPDLIEVRGPYVKSIACGSSTLLQAVQRVDGTSVVPCLAVSDEPVADFRSIMIDVARQPHSIDVLRDVVRFARLVRLRYVHLHLTDNQHFTFPFEPVTSKLKNNHSYTLEEMQALVQYADDRGITLIPEIDLPGHSRRLVESGFLGDAKSDRDVADASSAERIQQLLGAVIDVFASSPYLHIGGDESGAGNELVPFLGRMQTYVRSRGKRLIVWEGFHGAPTKVLPPTGDDRVIVASWESSYNAPWALLEAGYQLINASWRPTYVVGGDTLIHPGSSGGRKWAPEELAIWHKDRFMHWEPGRPVFEDAGPGDQNSDDGIWDVPSRQWRDLMLGGQMCVWEQKESSVIRDLRWRLPVLADRLWAGKVPTVGDVMARMKSADARVFGLVQPLDVQLQGAIHGSGSDSIYLSYEGEEAQVTVTSRLPGVQGARYATKPSGSQYTWIDFPKLEEPTQALGREGDVFQAITIRGGAAVAARAVDAEGRPVGGLTWARYMNWGPRVQVTEFDIGRRPSGTVPNFDRLPKRARGRTYTMPFLRGPLTHTHVVGQRNEATLRVDTNGSYRLGMKTQSGRATLRLDLNGDGKFSAAEALIVDTPTSEARITADVELRAGHDYALQIDHATALPRPVLIVTLEGPAPFSEDGKGAKEISPWLQPLEGR